MPEHTKVLVSEQSYITDFNPYAKGLLCPVLAFYIEEDWIHACEKCIELLVGESRGNTLTIHSQDPEVIRQFADQYAGCMGRHGSYNRPVPHSDPWKRDLKRGDHCRECIASSHDL